MAKTKSNAVAVPWRQRAFLPLGAASEIVGLSEGTLYKYERSGILIFQRLANRTLVTTASLAKFIKSAEPWSPSDRGKAGRAKRYARKAEPA